jgi:Uma2 family endonuclease
MFEAPLIRLTLDEFLKLPETQPASEYVDGQIIQKPALQGKQSIIQTELVETLNAQLKPLRIAQAFSKFRCTFAGRSIMPDISILRWTRIPRDQSSEIDHRFELAPDWIMEILAPDQSQTKVIKNMLHCLEYGTQIAWLIDPEERTIFVYQPQQQVLVFDLPEQRLPIPLFATDLRLTVAEVFA